MGLSSSRLLYLAFTLCCIVLAFLPQAKAALWLDWCVAPTRVLGELASPIGFFARRGARAAETEVASSALAEHAASRKLADDERYFALPDEESLISGRRFVHAQVVRRFRDAPDRIECALEEDLDSGLEPGLPVVLSNSYVGRVSSVDAAHRRLTVHLVTDKDFRVGARSSGIDASDPGAAMVVGGLAPARGIGTPLSIHNPDRTGELRGIVRVDEGLNPWAPFPKLSQGFRLGNLVAQPADRFAIAPEIDFADGLFRVVIVLAPELLPKPGALDFDVFADANWYPVRAYSACEPAAWREGVKIDFPKSLGARETAAVVAGARLVGFIVHAGALDSDVALLGDSGVAVPAQACIEGELAPVVLGKLISLGREGPGGPVRFLWSSVQPLPPAPDGALSRKARLFTGAGELGVPRGLLIGETLLPGGVGPHVIEVAERADARLLRKLWVWRGIEREERGGQP